MDHLQIRNFKDFLLLYNQISETCFTRCANTFLSRETTSSEDICISNCTVKHINANHKMMQIFMEVQPIFVRKRIEEAQNAQAALEQQTPKEESKPESVK